MSVTRRNLLKFGAVAAGSGLLAACGPATVAAPDKIKIGSVIPITGRYAAGGEQVKNGYEVAVEAINAKGGVDFGGKKIPLDLTIADDESDPAKTGQKLEQLNSAGVLAYLGGFGSDLHAAAAAIAEKNKVPYIGIAFALHKVHTLGFKYLFSPFAKSPQIAAASIALLATAPEKPTNIVGFIETTDWGAEMNKFWSAEAPKAGMKFTPMEYAPGTKDFSALILKAKEMNADVLVGVPSPPDGLAIAKQMKELDFNPKANMLIRSSDNISWVTNLGKDADYTMTMPGWANDMKYPGIPEMNAAHQTKYGKPAVAVTGPAYAAVQVLADAIKRSKTLERDALRDSIAATNLSTIIGNVTFAPDGIGNIPTVIVQYQGGKQVSVWPQADAAGKLIYPAVPFKQR